jgi:cAMP-dependent protein kinase regulator
MSRRNEIADRLAEVPLFSSCTKRERATIARHTEQASLDPDTPLVAEGELGDAFYVVLDGRAGVWRDGRRIGTIEPGGWFGELALLDAAPRNATVVADEPVTVAILGARVFAVLLREIPNMSEKLMRGLARRLREVDGHHTQ